MKAKVDLEARPDCTLHTELYPLSNWYKLSVKSLVVPGFLISFMTWLFWKAGCSAFLLDAVLSTPPLLQARSLVGESQCR